MNQEPRVWTQNLHASYRVVYVPYQLGSRTDRTMMFDAAIRLGIEIVWQENRSNENLCFTSGAALRRAKKVLGRVQVWEAAKAGNA